jgi:MSHA pilin protein MshD
MSNRHQFGMTLIELIVAIVILSVGLTGVLMAFITTVKSSAAPMLTKQMSAIADGMMEEVLLKQFSVATNAVPANSCARDTFNDVRDYNGYSTANVCDISGVAIAALTGYGVRVSVIEPIASPMTGVPAADVLVIKIDVTQGGSTYSLTGWRTNYAGP